MSAILIGDEIVHYEVLGRGRPVILLHSWIGSWRYWIPSMQAASISCRAYALDLWGFGDSAKNQARYSLNEQVALLKSFIEAMGIGKVALVGHGLGALVAIQFAGCNNGSTDRIMAVALSPRNNNHTSRLRASSLQELAAWLLNRTSAAEIAQADASKADVLAIRTALAGLEGFDAHASLLQDHPTCLWVQGGNDPLRTPAHLAGIESLPEKDHYLFFEGSGHFPMLDEPAKFNRLLVDFLSLNPGEDPRQLQLKEEWKRRVR